MPFNPVFQRACNIEKLGVAWDEASQGRIEPSIAIRLDSNAHAHTIDYDVMRSSPCILRDPIEIANRGQRMRTN